MASIPPAPASPLPSITQHSRSNSSSRRRRSYPSLNSFSITPLAPQYPLPPTADDPHLITASPSIATFYDLPHPSSRPQTPKSYLYTSNSISQEIPSSVISNSPSNSRPHSRTHSRSSSRGRRHIKSGLAVTDPSFAMLKKPSTATDLSSSKSVSHLSKLDTSFGSPKAVKSTGSRTRSNPKALNVDNEFWLLSTATALARGTAESKGQSWLGTRSSATSLVGTPTIEREGFAFTPIHHRTQSTAEQAVGEGAGLQIPGTSSAGALKYTYASTAASRASSRFASRSESRVGSKKGSRVNLMTPLGLRTPGEEDPPNHLPIELSLSPSAMNTDYFPIVGVDFDDDDDEEEHEEWEEEGIDDQEESELKRLVLGRVGGWVDWAVGWMDWREGLEGVLEDEEEQHEAALSQEGARNKRRGADVEGSRDRRRKRRGELKYADTRVIRRGNEGNAGRPAPAEGGEGAGMLGDARWFGGLVKSILSS